MENLNMTPMYRIRCKGISNLPYCMKSNHADIEVRKLIKEYQDLECHEFYKIQMLKNTKPSVHRCITNNRTFDNIKYVEKKVDIICKIDSIQKGLEREYYKNVKFYQFKRYQGKKIDLSLDINADCKFLIWMLQLNSKIKYM